MRADENHDEILALTGDRVEHLFEEATQLPPEKRKAYLLKNCGDEPKIMRIVEMLLDADSRAGDFLNPICPSIAELADDDAQAFIGRKFGVWKVTGKIGDGGSSQVFSAGREDEKYQRTVALKLLRTGLRSSDTIERFQRERHILAGLDHPCINKLLDGGTTEDGTPYLVVEFVEGELIDKYCLKKGLSLNSRVDLFLQVCSAVEYAHQRLIVHRDLKPGNIMVSNDGTPKLLDFGIAKLLDPHSLGLEASKTRSYLLMMTPTHSSPEQAQGLPVSTRSDVYSLGVVLYQLLTDALPYRIENNAPITKIMSVICEDNPVKPSQRRRENPLNSPIVARQLAGDLDSIALRALAKDPEERYASVERFAADLRRYRDGRPVHARGASFVYRAGKFFKRYRLPIAASLLFTVTLIAFAMNEAINSRELARALRETSAAQLKAEISRAEAVAVNDFLISMFEVSDPARSLGKTISAREILDRGAERIRIDLKEKPLIRARMMAVIASVYRKLGVYERAQPLLVEALKIQSELHGIDHLDVAATQDELGTLCEVQGRLEEAEVLFQKALHTRAAHNDPTHAATLNNLAHLYLERARYEEAKALFLQSLTEYREHLGEDSPIVAQVLNNLGATNRRLGHYEEAEAYYGQAITIRRKILPANHPDIGTSMNNLGTLFEVQQRHAEAEIYFQQALDIWENALGPEHSDVALALNNLAMIRVKQGKMDGSQEMFERALEIREHCLGPNHVDTAVVLNNLALMYWGLGRYEDVEPLWIKAAEAWQAALGPDHPTVATGFNNLGALNKKLGRLAESERYYRQSLAIRKKSLPPDHVDIGHSHKNLASLYRTQRRYHEEKDHLLSCLEVWRSSFEPESQRIIDVEARLEEIAQL